MSQEGRLTGKEATVKTMKARQQAGEAESSKTLCGGPSQPEPSEPVPILLHDI